MNMKPDYTKRWMRSAVYREDPKILEAEYSNGRMIAYLVVLLVIALSLYACLYV